MSVSPEEPTALVATPRELDKRWSRIARGDRGCAMDALSLGGALLTVLSFALARSQVLPMAVAYVCVGVWVLGFALGTRAQWRSGSLRKAALREGALVALGVVKAQPQLQAATPRVGKALVVWSASPETPRDVKQVAKVAKALASQLQAAPLATELAALLGDEFCFDRVTLQDPAGCSGAYVVSRIVVYPDRRKSPGSPVQPGTVLWAIDDPERNFLEQALAGA